MLEYARKELLCGMPPQLGSSIREIEIEIRTEQHEIAFD